MKAQEAIQAGAFVQCTFSMETKIPLDNTSWLIEHNSGSMQFSLHEASETLSLNGSTYDSFMAASRLLRDLLKAQGFMNADILLIALGEGKTLHRHISADGWIDELVD